MPSPVAQVNPQIQKSLYDESAGGITASLFYRVHSLVGPIDIVTACSISSAQDSLGQGIPGYGEEYATFINPPPYPLFVNHRYGRNLHEDSLLGTEWEVKVDFGFPYVVPPLSQATAYDWDYAEASEDYFIDHTGDNGGAANLPVVASNGQPFDSIPQREKNNGTVTISKNVATTFTIGAFASDAQYINSDSITIDGLTMAPYTAKLSGMTLSNGLNYAAGQQYRVAKMVIKHKTIGWNDVFADMGYYEWVTASTPSSGLKPIPDQNGNPVLKPWPLDGNGNAAANANTVPALINRQPYLYTTFSTLLSSITP